MQNVKSFTGQIKREVIFFVVSAGQKNISGGINARGTKESIKGKIYILESGN